MTRKIKTLLLGAAMMLPLTSVFAQQPDLLANKNELALDVAPIFRGNQFIQPQLQLMYRHYFNNCALRLKANANISNSNGETNNSSSSGGSTVTNTSKFSSSSIDVRPGFQWSKLLNAKSLYFYYGGDLVFQYTNGNGTNSNDYNTGGIRQHQEVVSKSNSLGGGLAPVLGLSLHLSPSFTFGVENSFAMVYQKGKGTSSSKVSIYDTDGNLTSENKTEGTQKFSGLNFNVDPIRNLSVFLSFRF